MRVHIVTAPDWILREYSDNWIKYFPDATLGTTPDRSADINFFVNYSLWEFTGGKTVSYFTHREEDEEMGAQFDMVAQESDVNISMCKITDEKVGRVAPLTPRHIVAPGINPAYKPRDVRIGVVARKYKSGRKRLDWMLKLALIDGIEIDYANGKYKAEEMPSFYAKQDYILITAKNEGGPMIVPEALACGKPLIMPYGVGWCDDYPGIRYSTYDELEGIVKGLVYDHDTYKKGGRKLWEIFTNLYNG